MASLHCVLFGSPSVQAGSVYYKITFSETLGVPRISVVFTPMIPMEIIGIVLKSVFHNDPFKDKQNKQNLEGVNPFKLRTHVN